MKLERVIISGGGTGGHIFPALAIANEIKRRFPDADILFVGAQNRMEMDRVPAAGYRIIGLPVTGLPRKPGMKMFSFFINLIKSNRLAARIIKEFNPQIAIGVGGYASGPLLRAATNKNIPALIQEQNSYAGITNKLLSRKAKKICVAYDHMDRYFPAQKIVLTGNPVRGNIAAMLKDKAEALRFFGIENSRKVILIIGGSLGARSVNEAVISDISKIATSDVEVIWQTGQLYFKNIQDRIEDTIPANVHMYEFLTRMDLAYSAADVIVSRAGAGTISELCIVGRPVILVPSPNVAEDHQTKNALSLSEKGAAVLIPDKDINEKLIPEAIRLINSSVECERLSVNIKKLAKPFATRQIVDEAEKLIGI